MAIRKLDSGRWELRTRDRYGKSVQRRFRTRREAEQLDREIEASKTGQRIVEATYGKVTVLDAAERWLAANPQWAHRTRERNVQILTQHILPFIGDELISGIRRDDVRRLVARWSESHAPRTVGRHFAVLKRLMSFAVEEDIVIRSPTVGVSCESPVTPQRRPIDADQSRALLGAIDRWYVPFVHTLLTTGMRWGEATNLRIADLHWTRREIQVNSNKTVNGLRTLPLAPDTFDLITQHLRNRQMHAAHGDEPLFSTPEGSPLNHSNFYKRMFKPAALAAGIPDVTLYHLRRTFATSIARGGADLKTI